VRTRLTMKNMDERVFEVLFKAISSVVEALEPFSPAAVDIHRMWHGSRGFFFMSPEGVQRRRDLTRQALRYGNWGRKFSPDYLAGRLRDIIEIHATEGVDRAPRLFDVSSRSWTPMTNGTQFSCRCSASSSPMRRHVQSAASWCTRAAPNSFNGSLRRIPLPLTSNARPTLRFGRRFRSRQSQVLPLRAPRSYAVRS